MGGARGRQGVEERLGEVDVRRGPGGLGQATARTPRHYPVLEGELARVWVARVHEDLVLGLVRHRVHGAGRGFGRFAARAGPFLLGLAPMLVLYCSRAVAFGSTRTIPAILQALREHPSNNASNSRA